MIGRVSTPMKQFALPLLCVAIAACGAEPPPATGLEAARERLFTESFERRGIDAAYVYEAFRRVPRAAFLPDDLNDQAWEDRAFRRPDGETVITRLEEGVLQDIALATGGRYVNGEGGVGAIEREISDGDAGPLDTTGDAAVAFLLVVAFASLWGEGFLFPRG